MAQFDVYRNPEPAAAADVPYLVEVQAELLQDLATCVVVPLARNGSCTEYPLAHLTPDLEFRGERLVLLAPQIGCVTRDGLGPAVGTVALQGGRVSAAIEFLLRGF